jgi:predicted dehydrogenase
MPNYALVGAAHIHTPNFVKKMADRDDLQVKFVWDHDAARAAKNAEQLPGSAVAELDSILADDSIDAVIVCSETNRHAELVTRIAEAGKHLFVEKPLGMGSADSYPMAEAINSAGVLFQTGYFMRSQPHHQFIKQQIETGAFGQITRVVHNNRHGGSLGRWFDTDWRWMADPSIAGVGAFGDLGTHSLDILLWWMGEVAEATGDIKVVLDNYDGCDEDGVGLLKFAGGAVGEIAAGWVSVANPVVFEVSGTKGNALLCRNELYFQSKHVEGADGKQPWPAEKMPSALPHAFDLFLDAVAGKQNVPLVTPDEAAYRGVVMEAIYEGAEQRTWVKPS